MSTALAIPEENPIPTLGWVLIGSGIAAGMVYAITRWLNEDDAPAKTGLFVPEGPPDDVVASFFAENPTASLMLLTDQVYGYYYPECPDVIDPNDPEHKLCAGKWVATRRKVTEMRDAVLPHNMLLITDALERELKWPVLLGRQDQPLVGVGYYATMANEIYDAVVTAAKDRPGVLFLMMENSTAISHGGSGVADVCPGSSGFVTAAPSYRSNVSSFEECLPIGASTAQVLTQVERAADLARPCDPLNPVCPPGYGCFPLGSTFACLPLDESDRGVLQDLIG